MGVVGTSAHPRSGGIEARTGLRVTPTSPRSPIIPSADSPQWAGGLAYQAKTFPARRSDIAMLLLGRDLQGHAWRAEHRERKGFCEMEMMLINPKPRSLRALIPWKRFMDNVHALPRDQLELRAAELCSKQEATYAPLGRAIRKRLK